MSKNRMRLGPQHVLLLLLDAVQGTTHVVVLLGKCVISFQIKEIQQNKNNLAKITFSPVKNYQALTVLTAVGTNSGCLTQVSLQTIQGQILPCMIMTYFN